MEGGHNNINIWNHSLLDQQLYGRTLAFYYSVNVYEYTMDYCLIDGIFPKYETLIQSVAYPTMSVEILQSGKKKLLECRMGIQSAIN